MWVGRACSSVAVLGRCAGKISTPAERYTSSEAAASRADVEAFSRTKLSRLQSPENFEILLLTPPYAIFAIESPELGRRRSNAQPRPPAARHSNGMVVAGDGSAPRHAQVWSAIVNGIEYPTTSNARSTL